MSVLNVSGNIKENIADPFVDHCQFTVSLLYHRVMVEGIYVGREVQWTVSIKDVISNNVKNDPPSLLVTFWFTTTLYL